MKAKRMRKLLMAAGMQRNAANVAVHACSEMPHQLLLHSIFSYPQSWVWFLEAVARNGAQITVECPPSTRWWNYK